MEQEIFINEKDELIESLHNYYASQAKEYKALFWIWCVLFALCLFSEVRLLTGNHTIDLNDAIYHFVISSCLLLGALYHMIFTKKIAKSDNAQDLLANYDKYVKNGNWIFPIIFTIFTVFTIATTGYSNDIIVVVLIIAAILIVWFLWVKFFSRRVKKIKRLRELLQQEN